MCTRPNDPNEPTTLSADNLVTLTATITDQDGDSASRDAEHRPEPGVPGRRPEHQRAGCDDADADGRRDQPGDERERELCELVHLAFGADGAGTITYALNVVAGPSGLTDTATNEAVNLVLNGARLKAARRRRARWCSR